MSHSLVPSNLKKNFSQNLIGFPRPSHVLTNQNASIYLSILQPVHRILDFYLLTHLSFSDYQALITNNNANTNYLSVATHNQVWSVLNLSTFQTNNGSSSIHDIPKAHSSCSSSLYQLLMIIRLAFVNPVPMSLTHNQLTSNWTHKHITWLA